MTYESDPRVETMHQIYHEGVSLEAVGERFGLSSTAVALFFKKAGLGTRLSDAPTATYESDPRAEAMYELYREGASLEEVGRRFDLSSAQVSLFFEKAGQTAPRTVGHRSEATHDLGEDTATRRASRTQPEAPPSGSHAHGARPIDQAAEMYELYESGATLEEIARRHGLTRDRVRLIFQRAPFKRASDPTDAQFDEMFALHEGGVTIRELSEQFGFTPGRMAKMFKNALYRRRGGEIVAAFRSLGDTAQVAARLAIPHKTVIAILRERLPDDAYLQIAHTHRPRNAPNPTPDRSG
jgi:transposase-like protein